MSAAAVHHDAAGRITSKRFGEAWVFYPGVCATGSRYAQPGTQETSTLVSGSFTPDFKVFFDHREALDATEWVPSGSTRAMDFECTDGGCLMLAHVYRDGWHS